MHKRGGKEVGRRLELMEVEFWAVDVGHKIGGAVDDGFICYGEEGGRDNTQAGDRAVPK